MLNRILALQVWHLQHLPVFLRNFLELRLEVLKLHRRNQQPQLTILIVMLASLVVNSGRHYRVHRKQSQFFYPSDMQLTSEDNLSNGMDILPKSLVEEQCFRNLQVV